MTQIHEVEEKLFQLQGKLFQLTESNLVEVSQASTLGDVHGKSKLFMAKNISIYFEKLSEESVENPDQVLAELLKTEQMCDSMLKLPTLEQSDGDDDELQQAKKNYEEMGNKFKKLLEEQKQKLEQVEQKQNQGS